jgi:hypothetical protein
MADLKDHLKRWLCEENPGAEENSELRSAATAACE